MKRDPVVVILLAVLLGAIAISLSGPICPMGLNQGQWQLEVWVGQEGEMGNETIVELQITLSGHVSQTTIDDVELIFLDNNGDQIHVIEVGTLSGYTEKFIVTTVNRPPDRILFKTGEIDTGNDHQYWIKGVERNEEGKYTDFIQVHKEC